MSEFMCVSNHPLKSGEYFCPICGGSIYSEDGMSRREVRRREADDPDGDADEPVDMGEDDPREDR